MTLLYAYLITTCNLARLPYFILSKTTRQSERENPMGVRLSDTSSGYS